MKILHCDGLCEPNPGQGTWAFVVIENGQTIHEDHGDSGAETTNNVAEYDGFIKALEWIEQEGITEPITLFSDSKLVINQSSGQWDCHTDHLRPFVDRAKSLRVKLGNVAVAYVKGIENEADEWTRVAFEEITGKPAALKYKTYGKR